MYQELTLKACWLTCMNSISNFEQRLNMLSCFLLGVRYIYISLRVEYQNQFLSPAWHVAGDMEIPGVCLSVVFHQVLLELSWYNWIKYNISATRGTLELCSFIYLVLYIPVVTQILLTWLQVQEFLGLIPFWIR